MPETRKKIPELEGAEVLEVLFDKQSVIIDFVGGTRLWIEGKDLKLTVEEANYELIPVPEKEGGE